MMVGKFFLVLDDLTVELVDHSVDGCVHVFLNGIGINSAACDINFCFCLVAKFFNGQDAFDTGDAVEMSLDTFNLLLR